MEEDDWLQLSTLRAVQTELWQAKQAAIEDALRCFEPLWHEMQSFEAKASSSSDADASNNAPRDALTPSNDWADTTTQSMSLFLPIDQGDDVEHVTRSILAPPSAKRQDGGTQTEIDDHAALVYFLPLN